MAQTPNQAEAAAAPAGEGRVGPPPVTASEPPALAAKANDLEAIRGAVVDAAGVSAGLWFSYLFVLFYLLVAAGGVTHQDLFFANPVKLPFLSVDLPLRGFFWLGPMLFLIVHTYVLLHFVLLAGKVGVFEAQLRAQIADPDIRAQLRRQLPINIFVQFLAGPLEARQGPVGFLLRLIAWISLMIGPVSLLVFFQLQFLPYHAEWITWWQRLAVTLDLGIVWVLWPAIVRGEAIGPALRTVGWGTALAMTFVTLVAVPLVLAIATFPGEWLEEMLPSFVLRNALVAGEVDYVTRRPTSLWSNRLVLPGIDVIDHARFDTEAKIVAAPVILSLRARHFEHAVLIGAVLRKVDFTGAWLQGAQLSSAQLRGASLRQVLGWRADLTKADGQRSRVAAVDLRPMTDLDRLKQLAASMISDPELRVRIITRLETILNAATPLAGEQEMVRRWGDLQTATSADTYETELARIWREIGCAAAGAPYVLTRLADAANGITNPFVPASVSLSRLAGDFLKPDCAGARGISAITRAQLTVLRDQVPPP